MYMLNVDVKQHTSWSTGLHTGTGVWGVSLCALPDSDMHHCHK
jgi:hypothetical protein